MLIIMIIGRRFFFLILKLNYIIRFFEVGILIIDNIKCLLEFFFYKYVIYGKLLRFNRFGFYKRWKLCNR